YTAGAIGFVLSLILLLGSIGALSLRPWARKLLMGYAVADIMYNTVKLFLAMVWIMPEVMRQMERMPSQGGPDPKQIAKFARWSMLVTNWAVWLVLVTFAIIVLVVMTRPHVVAAFEPEAVAPAELPPAA